MTRRIRSTLAVLAVAALGAAPAGAATDEYVPFVTDFPKPQEQYVPFVSDFPRPATPAPAEPAADGVDWAVPAQGTVVIVAALLTAAALAAARRRQAEPRLGDC